MTAAAVMTYDSLVTDIGSYLERTDTDTVNQIPRFIALAEHTIATEIKFLGNLSVVTGNFTTSDPVIEKPAGWRKTVSMNVTVDGKKQPMFVRKYEVLTAFAPDQTVTSTPKYYADYDYDHWLVAPTPPSALAFEVSYYGIEPLSSDNQSNYFTRHAPQALLYGALLQSAPFLKNDERIAMWQGKYDAFINSLKTEDVERILDRSAFVKGT